jgi:malate dehydrogenase (oxaloacetate-decarboxylating)(NADP+)
VGEACLKWSEIYQYPEGMSQIPSRRAHAILELSALTRSAHNKNLLTISGLYLSYSDRGNLANVLRNWPQPKVEITVGKLSLYTACAGIRPEVTLPLTLDLGTNNEKLLKDPFYMGSRMKKASAAEEAKFLDELMVALNQVWPG